MRHPIVTHIGLGDFFSQLNAYERLCFRDDIAVPCYDEHHETVAAALYPLMPNATVYVVPNVKGEDKGSPSQNTYRKAIEYYGMSWEDRICAGVYAGDIGQDFTKAFYRDYGLPYEPWNIEFLRPAIYEVAQIQWPINCKRQFVHDDPVRGFNINRLINRCESFVPDFSESPNALSYFQILTTSRKIAVIDSMFFWFVNAIWQYIDPECDLQLHCYARWPRNRCFRFETKLNWRYIW